MVSIKIVSFITVVADRPRPTEGTAREIGTTREALKGVVGIKKETTFAGLTEC